MSPVKDVMGVRMRFDSDPPLPSEETPQKFRLTQLQDEQKRRIAADEALWKKLDRIQFMQWAIGVLVTLVGIYMTWLTTSQSDRNGTAGAAAASAYLATELPKHLKSTEDTAREGGKEGAREFYEQLVKAQNPPPLVVKGK